jgi:hypothetical protein
MTDRILADIRFPTLPVAASSMLPAKRLTLRLGSSNYLRASIAAAALPTTSPVAQP